MTIVSEGSEDQVQPLVSRILETFDIVLLPVCPSIPRQDIFLQLHAGEVGATIIVTSAFGTTDPGCTCAYESAFRYAVRTSSLRASEIWVFISR